MRAVTVGPLTVTVMILRGEMLRQAYHCVQSASVGRCASLLIDGEKLRESFEVCGRRGVVSRSLRNLSGKWHDGALSVSLALTQKIVGPKRIPAPPIAGAFSDGSPLPCFVWLPAAFKLASQAFSCHWSIKGIEEQSLASGAARPSVEARSQQ